MVSFDGRGSLVAEIDFEKEIDELVYQARNDAVVGRLRAATEEDERRQHIPLIRASGDGKLGRHISGQVDAGRLKSQLARA